MTLIRRFALLAAFAFWQGGFTFYAAVAVPIGTDVLGSEAEQGLITRQVSYWINVYGIVATLLMTWDALYTRSFRRLRFSIVSIMAFSIAILFILHRRLDAMFDIVQVKVTDRTTFYTVHRQYMWISMVQWALGVAFLLLSLLAWKRFDASSSDRAIG